MLLQGHAVTLTFKVATQTVRAQIAKIATHLRTSKFHAHNFNGFML